MHLLFVDESGTPPKTDKITNRYFVIAGVSIPEARWMPLRDLMLGLKARYKVRGEVKWRYFAPSNTDSHNPFKRLSGQERDDFRREVFEMLTRHKDIRVIACVTSCEEAYKANHINCGSDLYEATYKPVSERFQYYLQDLGKVSGAPQFGIVIADHRGREDDKRFRGHHQKLLHSSSEFMSSYKNLIETLLFVPSNLSLGVQFADMAAGAIWRKFERGDSKWYDALAPALRCDGRGVVDGYGIVKFPKRTWK